MGPGRSGWGEGGQGWGVCVCVGGGGGGEWVLDLIDGLTLIAAAPNCGSPKELGFFPLLPPQLSPGWRSL
jgi:hypothetical protein